MSGLLTGQDIVKQLKDKNLGEALYLPRNVLRSGADLFLDDYTLADVEGALQVPVNIVNQADMILWMPCLEKMHLNRF